MTLRPEREIAEIRQHLAELRRAPWMDRAREWWPRFLFHCTDISNAVNILRQEELGSRQRAISTGQLKLDIASSEVIAQTDSQWKDYVRLYFRPKTPTQYRNEGFRPVGQRSLDSHCPVPVYLVFDALTVLSRADCRFSDGNLGSARATARDDVPFLKQIPFDKVYHNDSQFFPTGLRQIVYHRHAEVLVPERMGLESLRYIYCRSPAEYETLLHLLPLETRSLWQEKIGIRPELGLFNREWTFVERVEMSAERLIFRFNRITETPGPFDAKVVIVETETGQRLDWCDGEYQAKNTLPLQLHDIGNPHDYTACLSLDGNLAYAARYQGDALPF